MEINRNNYESFFLLYLDGELIPSQTDRRWKNFWVKMQICKKNFPLLQQTVLFTIGHCI